MRVFLSSVAENDLRQPVSKEGAAAKMKDREKLNPMGIKVQEMNEIDCHREFI